MAIGGGIVAVTGFATTFGATGANVGVAQADKAITSATNPIFFSGN
jgi:hypothetical protein